jgi:hypothetical protein
LPIFVRSFPHFSFCLFFMSIRFFCNSLNSQYYTIKSPLVLRTLPRPFLQIHFLLSQIFFDFFEFLLLLPACINLASTSHTFVSSFPCEVQS